MVLSHQIMKILHLTGEFPPFVLGGLGTYVSEIALRQSRLGHQVVVCVLQGEEKNYNKTDSSRYKAIKIISRSVSYTHLTLPTIYSV